MGSSSTGTWEGGGGVKEVLGSVSRQSAGLCLLLLILKVPPALVRPGFWSHVSVPPAAQGKVGPLGTGTQCPSLKTVSVFRPLEPECPLKLFSAIHHRTV